jgi:hypothetical protein
LTAQKVKVEATSNSTVDDLSVTKEPFLAMSITGVYAVGLGLAGDVVASFVIEGERPIDVPVHGVAGVDGVEGLRVIVAQAEVTNVLCKAVNIVILDIESAPARLSLRWNKHLTFTMLVASSRNWSSKTITWPYVEKSSSPDLLRSTRN